MIFEIIKLVGWSIVLILLGIFKGTIPLKHFYSMLCSTILMLYVIIDGIISHQIYDLYVRDFGNIAIIITFIFYIFNYSKEFDWIEDYKAGKKGLKID